MRTYLSDLFSFRSVVSNIVWAILISLAVRAITWLGQVHLASYREVGFWIIVPTTALIVLGILSSLVNQGPRLTVSIDQATYAPMTDDNTSTAVILFASALNAGTPTILDNWHLDVRLSPTTTVTGQLQHISETITLVDVNGRRMVYSAKHSLVDKSVENPIPTGGRLAGLLFFKIPNVTRETVYRPETLLLLTCTDVRGQKYHVSRQVLAETHGADRYPPGMRPLGHN